MRVSLSILVAILALLCCLAPAAAADKYTYFRDQEYTGRSGDKTYGLAPTVAVCEQKSLRPVAWFAASKPDDGKSRLLYLLIFKTPADYSAGFQMSGQVRGSSNDGAEGKTAAVLGKQKVDLPKITARLGGGYRFVSNSKIVYLERGQSTDFTLLDLTSQQTRPLTHLSNQGGLGTFDITPDGKQIVFERSRGNSDIYLIDLPKP